MIAHPVIEVESSDDDCDTVMPSVIPPSLGGVKSATAKQYSPDDMMPPGSIPLLPPSVNEDVIKSPVPLRVIYPTELLECGFISDVDGFLDDENALYDEEGVLSGLVDDTYVLEENVHDEVMGGYVSQQECSFHSLHSETSIIKQIEGMGVEGASIKENISDSSYLREGRWIQMKSHPQPT